MVWSGPEAEVSPDNIAAKIDPLRVKLMTVFYHAFSVMVNPISTMKIISDHQALRSIISKRCFS